MNLAKFIIEKETRREEGMKVHYFKGVVRSGRLEMKIYGYCLTGRKAVNQMKSLHLGFKQGCLVTKVNREIMKSLRWN